MALNYNRKYNSLRGIPIRADRLSPDPFTLTSGVVTAVAGQDATDDTKNLGNIGALFGTIAVIVETAGAQLDEKVANVSDRNAIVDFGPSVWQVDLVASSGTAITPGTALNIYTTGTNAGRFTNNAVTTSKHTQPVSYTHLTLPTNREV